MKYLEKSFSVAVGGRAYRDGYNAIDWRGARCTECFAPRDPACPNQKCAVHCWSFCPGPIYTGRKTHFIPNPIQMDLIQEKGLFPCHGCGQPMPAPSTMLCPTCTEAAL